MKQKGHFLYLAVFISGASVLILEILGSRILAPFYGSTIYIWSSLISVTLGFLALGYFIGGKIADKYRSYIHFYGIIFLAGASTLGFYSLKPLVILASDSFGFIFAPLVASLLLFGIPFLLFGMVGPYAIRLSASSLKKTGTEAGTIFAISTVGSVLGAITSGFFLIPLFSVKSILYGIAVVTLLLFVTGVRRVKASCLATLVLAGLVVLNGNKFFYHSISKRTYEQEILYQTNNYYGSNRLVGQPRALDGQICFLIDGTIQGCIDRNNKDTYYKPVAAIVGELPEGSGFLMLGLGLGRFFYYYDTSHLNVDIVDINPAAFEAMRKAGIEPKTLSQNEYIDDARAFLEKHEDKKYDVIFTDLLSNVVYPDHVFTQEAFSTIRDRLNPDGKLILGIIGKANGEDEMINSVVTTLHSVFPNVYIHSDEPNEFFNYNLIMASEESIAVKPLGFKRAEIWPGRVVVDEHNTLWGMWTRNLALNIPSMDNFRIKFKRLSEDDFYE